MTHSVVALYSVTKADRSQGCSISAIPTTMLPTVISLLLWTFVVPVHTQSATRSGDISMTTTPNSAALGCIQRNSGGEDYTGQLTVAASGKTCLQWTYAPDCSQDLPDNNITLSENFCRNPTSPDRCRGERPWCYTDDLNWDYCDVPICGDEYSACMTALGMGSGAIADSQITATSYYTDLHLPHMARINSSNTDYWMPANAHYLQYLKIDLLSPHNITKIYIQGSPERYTKTFNVLYSLDDLVWEAYSETRDRRAKEFNGNYGSDIAPVYFNNPFAAVLIVIVPRSWHMDPGLKLELFGCQAAATIPQHTDITEDSQQPIQWSSATSPYVVQKLISIHPDTTLTIDGGVKVVFIGQESGLSVYGCLDVNADEDLQVQMMSNNPLSLLSAVDENGYSFWQGIFINSEASDTLFINLLLIYDKLK